MSATGKVQGTWNESSRERTVQGTNGPRTERSAGFIRSRERKFSGRTVPGTKVPGNESNSLENECSFQHSLLRPYFALLWWVGGVTVFVNKNAVWSGI